MRRSNRLGGTLVPVVSVLACAMLAWQERGSDVDARGVLAARELTIVHADGSVALRLGTSEDGGSFVRLFASDGTERASLEVGPRKVGQPEDGERVRLVLLDARGERSIELGHRDARPHGDELGLTFYGEDDRPFLALWSGGPGNGNRGALTFLGRDGPGVAELGAGRFGAEPALTLNRPQRAEDDRRGARGPARFRVDLQNDLLLFGGSKGSLEYELGGRADVSCLRLRDARGTPRFEREHR